MRLARRQQESGGNPGRLRGILGSMLNSDYERVARAIEYLDTHFDQQPELGEVARHTGLSEFHFQRLFRRWAGISPKRFLQFLTADSARERLRVSASVLDAAFDAGLSGPGRLHDLLVSVYAATPGEIKQGGEGLTIRYGRHASPFGDCLLAATDRGICGLAFLDGPGDRELERIREQWPRASFIEKPRETARLASAVFHRGGKATAPLALHLSGTNFQLRVWEALLRIPAGAVASYEQVAASVCSTKAARAVGAAVAANPVAFLIPCHRVIKKMGAFGGYHWGTTRKKALLAWEAAQIPSKISASGTSMSRLVVRSTPASATHGSVAVNAMNSV